MGSLCDRLEQEAVFQLAHIKAGEKVLDIGCGTGIYTLTAARRGARVVGIDPSLDMLLAAKSKLEREGHPMRLIAATAEALPFRAHQFDLISGVTSLCFVSRPERALAEAWRVLKAEGRLVLGELNRHSPWAWLRKLKGYFKDSVYSRAKFWGREELNTILTRQGFDVVEIRPLIYFPPINSRLFLKTYPLFERFGERFFPKTGAFVTIGASKTILNPRTGLPIVGGSPPTS